MHGIKRPRYFAYCVEVPIPLRQGLKPPIAEECGQRYPGWSAHSIKTRIETRNGKELDYAYVGKCWSAHSIKTRIETGCGHRSWRFCITVEVPIPLRQGLKLFKHVKTWCIKLVEVPIPLRQGLKHTRTGLLPRLNSHRWSAHSIKTRIETRPLGEYMAMARWALKCPFH